ncbi:MAG: GNAT family N-acetyltransferase [Myxococcales bacterium]|nr:GNAT family N-acetyltransferase [Myxococcales bacterium]USN49809.1 MAG: GNAT family N-acetyltransferase [Myxococcales bacterium]
MKENVTIELNSAPLEANKNFVREALHEFNVQKIGKDEEMSFFAYDENRKIIGGLILYAEMRSIFIDILWVCENHRGYGIGSELMRAAEEEGYRRGVTYSTTDTLAFQAARFYQKLGYHEIGVVKDYIEGHDRIFFRKALTRE